MTHVEALSKKITELKAFAANPRRCTPRPPRELVWVYTQLTGSMSKREAVTIPSNCYWPSDYGKANGPPDRIARTFVALEELEEWLNRLDAGLAAHQVEIEKQARAKIVRLDTYAAFTPTVAK